MCVRDATPRDGSPPDWNSRPLLELTKFQRDLLFVVVSLEGTEPSGVRIKAELREAYGDEINTGRFYRNLHDLIEKNFVEASSVGGRENTYQIRSSARTQLQAHVAWEKRCLLRQNGGEEQ